MANESSPRREPSSTSRIRKAAPPASKGAEDAAARKTAEPAPVDPTPAAPAEFRDRAEREPYTTEREPSRYREPIRDVRERNERESGIPVRERLARDRGDRDGDGRRPRARSAIREREPRRPRESEAPRERCANASPRAPPARVEREPPSREPVAVAAADGRPRRSAPATPTRTRTSSATPRSTTATRRSSAASIAHHRAAADDDAAAHRRPPRTRASTEYTGLKKQDLIFRSSRSG